MAMAAGLDDVMDDLDVGVLVAEMYRVCDEAKMKNAKIMRDLNVGAAKQVKVSEPILFDVLLKPMQIQAIKQMQEILTQMARLARQANHLAVQSELAWALPTLFLIELSDYAHRMDKLLKSSERTARMRGLNVEREV
ncbi:hypothetical protein QDY71_10510 [Kingella negevensis]|nr:hypothetical protein [Kingella negevensis]MDK4680785.1 hypothetical protein [Kingella negevensis]MDK4681492.1 hypothetical protein [Kingella negevensis]MDK4684224.1 hypothetical protein [Kingella negevensis]MDK4691879.1 hypothetical protein [Kingella negevensis]MDK4692968.1 hypothetical protein [Kingella negevensis]